MNLVTLVLQEHRRFRWAVCQIDAIQRLRGQQPEDIRKAIKSLPKTLDETYERIFISIREEDYPFVKSSLSFICAFGDTHAMPLFPAEQLLKLVLHSLSSSNIDTGQQPNTLADLRDICGCLLTPSINGQCNILELAHYTVKEYLYSGRIATGQASHFALSDSIARRALATAALSVACQAEGWNRAYAADNLGNFGPYCMTLSVSLLRACETDALQDRQLRQLYHMLFNPSRPSWGILKFEDGQLNMIPFERFPDNLDVAIFANLVSAGLHQLAKELLERLDKEEILFRSPIHIRDYLCGTGKKFDCGVIGRNLIDFFREWGNAYDRLDNREEDCFSLIVGIMIEFYNPTLALLMYIGAHYHSRPGECGLEHFLDRGADPNAVGYRITPLQIATWQLDIQALEELLEGGADVNAIGDPNAPIPTLSDGILGIIPSDVTPLSIARKGGKIGVTTDYSGEGTEEIVQKIQNLLRAHGAGEDK